MAWGLSEALWQKSKQKALVRQKKVQHRSQQPRIARRQAQVRGFQARDGQESADCVRLARQPRKRFQGQDFRPCRGLEVPSIRQDAVKTFSLILRKRRIPVTPALFAGRRELSWTPRLKTVLIVEDNELNMKLFHDLLDAHGYNILQTKDGMEALDIAREHHPDLILMDIQLPEVSGLEVTKWLKEDESLKSIPVVAVTAFAMKGDEEVIRQGGCEAYISKPISVTSFLETVRRFIG